MTAEEISDLAMKQMPLPKTEYLSEQWLYTIIRHIYSEYRSGIIDAKQGKREKLNAVKQYEHIRHWERVFRRQAAVGKELGELMCKANKQGCDICRQMTAFIDGRILIEEDEQ